MSFIPKFATASMLTAMAALTGGLTLIDAAYAQSGAGASATGLAAPSAASIAPETANVGFGGEVNALVVAEDEATLASPMPGRINKMNYRIGQSFPAGAVLMEFDCSEHQAKLQSLEAELKGARETHLAKLRLQSLGAAGELEVMLAATTTEKARAQVDQQEAQMKYCKVLAPFAGRVARIKAKAFEAVNPGQPLIEIVSQGPVKLTMHVPSSWISRLRVGTPVTVRFSETGRPVNAKVSQLNARVDGVSQSIEVEARLSGKSTELLPGMIGTAVFAGRAR